MENKETKSNVAQREESVLDFWQKNHIFEKTLEKESPKGEFVFYDGPPFGTGTPHYGHILAGTIKDVFPRYQTMRGYHVRRQWGWDCHGLPIENLIEKEFNLNSKKDIESFGVGKFNGAAKNSVLRYADEWKKTVPRVGRFVDMETDYKTMDASYTESIWWAFKTLHEKGLVYEGYKSMHLCPRCETTLSNFEVGQGYKDITDISVYVKFELKDEPGTYMIAWTTTPWTLPGNVALAINPEIEYAKASHEGVKFILAKDRISSVFKNGAPEILETFPGKDLIGKSYIPPFDYYFKNPDSVKNGDRGWKIYEAEFVTLDAGTGIVHIAPAFGEDDMNLSKKENLPFIQHVSTDGRFKPEVSHFSGMHVKPKDNHQAADIEVIKYLAHNHYLFEKEKIIHSYPHCWRCSTPLLNYASSSWFVEVTKFKDELVSENQKITWVPDHIKDGRFGNWLSGARDWAISRSRYWGAPLPVWRNEESGEIVVLGGLSDLEKYTKKSGNKYFVMRHGQSESNLGGLISSEANAKDHITEEGKREVVESAKEILKDGIDFIICSPFTRTKETVSLLKNELGLTDEKIIFDPRLGEVNAGFYNGKTWAEYAGFFKHEIDRFTMAVEGGESLNDVKRRMSEVLYELERDYENKRILILSHGAPIWLLYAGSKGMDAKESLSYVKAGEFAHFKNAEVRELAFAPLPHNENYVLDFHRPYIDEFPLFDSNGNKLKRVSEVFDCWFESGSMPFAQFHYPFENKEIFEKNFPADFIAEGLDQTRGWFYSLIVLGVALFGKSPYKRVIVNGLILAEDGQKMSKSLKNYPDLNPTVEKYGADALRLYLLNSPVVRGEELRFSEKDLSELGRRIIGRLDNVLAFYELYKEGFVPTELSASENILDKWILSRLAILLENVESAMESYELDRSVRPFDEFVDDLSTWYLRRSRERLKDGEISAKETLYFILKNFAKIIAPFAPFVAEDLWQKLKTETDRESVHLESWPELGLKADASILEKMKETREIVTLGLEKRQKAGIKVRQPLSQLSIGIEDLSGEFLDLVKDELNIKDVKIDASLEKEILLSIEITPELKTEGDYRELVRSIQDLRKQKGLTPSDPINLSVETNNIGQDLILKFSDDLKKVVLANEINFKENNAPQIKIDELVFKIEIES